MEMILDVASTIVSQFQKPTLAFLIGGMVLAAFKSRLEVPEPVYKFIVLLLLLKVGLGAGMSVRDAEFMSLLVPALAAVAVGVGIVLIGGSTLARWKGVSRVDGVATAGLFGAVSASTLAASMAVLDGDGIEYEGFIGALYPFMDIAALVTAIVMAKLSVARKTVTAHQVNASGSMISGTMTSGTMTMGSMPGSGSMSGGTSTQFSGVDSSMIKEILTDTFRSPAISALVLGLALGMFADPSNVYTSFYQPIFQGLLSILMLIMGMEAWSRLSEMRKVAHAYILYGLAAPILHGLLGFGAGLLAHYATGFSAGGVVLLSIMAASSSDISGPPTMRAALPEANPSAYVGTSTGLGTPVAILSIPLFVALADWAIGF